MRFSKAFLFLLLSLLWESVGGDAVVRRVVIKAREPAAPRPFRLRPWPVQRLRGGGFQDGLNELRLNVLDEFARKDGDIRAGLDTDPDDIAGYSTDISYLSQLGGGGAVEDEKFVRERFNGVFSKHPHALSIHPAQLCILPFVL